MKHTYLLESAPGARAVINGEEYNYFGGTSYYEFHKNEEVLKSAADALNKYGLNSASSRNSYGTTPLILELEKTAAEYFDSEDSVYLSSGFLSDLAAIQVLYDRKFFDRIFIDEISHYSNNYAAKLSGKPFHIFKHVDEKDLRKNINQNLKENEKPLIITDGVFPIFGRIAPIPLYLKIAEEYGGIVWTDDAHAVGILGENGRGTYEHFNLKSERLFFGATMSKAFGGFGGIIPGSAEFINEIKYGDIQNGSTPPPSSAAAAGLTGLKILRSTPSLKNNLMNNAAKLKSGLTDLGIKAEDSCVPIAAWELESLSAMEKVHNELMKKNICIQLINYVGAGESGALRIVVFATHTEEQIDHLLSELGGIL